MYDTTAPRQKKPISFITRHRCLVSALLVLLAVPSQTWADTTRMLHVDLSYSGVAAYYNLYKNGVLVCSSTSNAESQIDCPIELDPTPMTFVLTAVDEGGVESPQSTPYVLVPSTVPTAKFSTTIPSTTAPVIVGFDASESYDYDGMIIRYIWNFGDGSNGTGKFIDHTFSAPGTYVTKLTVIDDDNHSSTITSQVTIVAGPLTLQPPVSLPASGNASDMGGTSPTPSTPNQTTLPKNVNPSWNALLSRLISFLFSNIFAMN